MRAWPPPLLILVWQCLHPFAASAAWPVDGTAISTAPAEQGPMSIASDGSGGAILAWKDTRNSGTDIYVQRVNEAGDVEWTVDGVALATGTGHRSNPSLAADGFGGAFVTWHDDRSGNYDIYMQRVNANGAAQWAPGGINVYPSPVSQLDPVVTSDLAGHATVFWRDARFGTYSLVAQRIDMAGSLMWAASGVLVSFNDDCRNPVILPDGAGGAIAVWARGYSAPLYAQRVSAAGTTQWAPGGLLVCSKNNIDVRHAAASDGTGGAIVCWSDYRNGTSPDLYLQRIDASGAAQWTADGIPISTTIEYAPLAWRPLNSAITSDGAGGAIVTWIDQPDPESFYDVKAQRVNALGAKQWGPDGITVCDTPETQLFPDIVRDSAGGAIVTWSDSRNGTDDVHAQRIDASGVPQWPANGVAVCTAPASQIGARATPTDNGGAVTAWYDYRNGTMDIYAQRIDPDGPISAAVSDAPHPASALVSPNYPNPFSGHTTIEVTLRNESTLHVEVFDTAGHRVRRAHMSPASTGITRLTFDGRDDLGHRLPSGVYFYRVHAGANVVTRKMVIAQ